MKILLAIDSFKGCLSSTEIESLTAQFIREAKPHCLTDCLPIADGGEGTLPILSQLLDAERIRCMVHDPLFRPIQSYYAYSAETHTALIEMAAASGLPLLKDTERNPLLTTSYGTGELIADALDRGARQFIIGIGGSATNDAGIGMLQALGYRFYDSQQHELGQGGQILSEIHSWDGTQVHPALKEAQFRVACDVTNPFYGPQGAAPVFAPQKGADAACVQVLDSGMKQLAERILTETGIDLQQHPGSGAAGGMGGGLLTFLHATLESGADLLLRMTRFEERLQDASLLVTGEGRMDNQTLMGKIPGKILELGKQHHLPVIGLCGSCTHRDELLQAGFTRLCPITPEGQPLAEALQRETAIQNLRRTVSESLLPLIEG